MHNADNHSTRTLESLIQELTDLLIDVSEDRLEVLELGASRSSRPAGHGLASVRSNDIDHELTFTVVARERVQAFDPHSQRDYDDHEDVGDILADMRDEPAATEPWGSVDQDEPARPRFIRNDLGSARNWSPIGQAPRDVAPVDQGDDDEPNLPSFSDLLRFEDDLARSPSWRAIEQDLVNAQRTITYLRDANASLARDLTKAVTTPNVILSAEDYARLNGQWDEYVKSIRAEDFERLNGERDCAKSIRVVTPAEAGEAADYRDGPFALLRPHTTDANKAAYEEWVAQHPDWVAGRPSAADLINKVLAPTKAQAATHETARLKEIAEAEHAKAEANREAVQREFEQIKGLWGGGLPFAGLIQGEEIAPLKARSIPTIGQSDLAPRFTLGAQLSGTARPVARPIEMCVGKGVKSWPGLHNLPESLKRENLAETAIGLSVNARLALLQIYALALNTGVSLYANATAGCSSWRGVSRDELPDTEAFGLALNDLNAAGLTMVYEARKGGDRKAEIQLTMRGMLMASDGKLAC